MKQLKQNIEREFVQVIGLINDNRDDIGQYTDPYISKYCQYTAPYISKYCLALKKNN